MKRIITVLVVVGMLAALAPAALATNGDNLIAIGPIARSMGGVGIAAPQDAISAVFSNPAGMCFGPYCPGSEFNFAGTLFMPKPTAKISIGALGPLPADTIQADADEKVYAIPAIGISYPITEQWRFGLSAYGVSGLGVDYRDTAIEDSDYYNFGGPTAPLAAGEYTQLQILKFSPSIAFQPTDVFSLGLGVHIDYANLDLRNGSSFNYAYGVQLGGLVKPVDWLSVGATYTSPQSVDYENVVASQDPNTGAPISADLELEQPQEVGIGLAVEPILGKLLLELDYKWVNWADAAGYEDFDWDDQNVFALGVQFKPVEKLALRAGYNYGKSPVNEHSGWDGSFDPGTGQPNDAVNVQGTIFPRYYYETFRIVGFPAIVEQHLTLGVGYEFTKDFAVSLGYMHAFEESVREEGTNPFGQPVVVEATLEEDSLDFGLTWRF